MNKGTKGSDMTLTVVGWLLDAGTKSERAIVGAGWAPSMGGQTAEPMVLRADVVAEIERLRTALQEADTIMGHDDSESDWREKWAHLWSNV